MVEVASVATPGFGSIFYVGDGGVGAGTKASKTFGTGAQMLKIFSKLAGTAGNSKTAGLTVSGTASFSFTVSRTALAIVSGSSSGTATTKVGEAISALYQDATFEKYWEATVGTGDGSGVLVAGASAALSGGLDGTEVFTAVSEITDISGPGRELTLFERTHMLSPGGYKEYGPSLKDANPVSIPMNFIYDTMQQYIIGLCDDGTLTNFRIEVPLESTTLRMSFAGYVTKFEPMSKIAGALSANVTIKPTGPITEDIV